MITNYRHLSGPALDEDCQCHCMDERNAFQAALDEIALITEGRKVSDLTDIDLDRINEQVAQR